MNRETRLAALRMDIHEKAKKLAHVYVKNSSLVPALVQEIIDYSGFILKYNPNQPRVPAGSPDGGQWTSGEDGDQDTLTDAITPVYPLETAILSLLPGGRLLSAWRALTEDAEAAETVNTDWVLGNFKSAVRWANQLTQRNWTPDDITNTILTGDQYPAPNKVNPGNTATRYQDPDTGRYVVRDDVTNEILQVSEPDFIPNE